MDVNNISNVFSNAKIGSFSENSNDKTKSINFAEMLNDAINKVNDEQVNADKMGELLAEGKVDNVHEVMIATQKAELTLNLAIEIKSKILEAYKEIMRLQI
ncbi:flagellar hook-basal body complex protein FliE [Clostridiaceae bacterium HSG29]|nr:flagellar hook-basal body complex protein FliE [Clostridiaceae bacterium HSG29]